MHGPSGYSQTPGTIVGDLQMPVLATADDDDLSVYAHDKSAVVVTHDKELTERRKRNTFGQHVRLKCKEPDACSILEAHLDEMVAVLGHHPEVVVEVSKTKVKVCLPRWA